MKTYRIKKTMITKKEIGKGYDRIAEKIYVSEAFYQEVIAIEKHWRGAILDAGCGQGPILFALTRKKFFNITRLIGIDISDRLLAMAREKVPAAEIIKADLDNMPFSDASFDFVVMVDVFQYLSDFDNALEEIKRVLKQGGKFIVTVPNRKWILFNSYIKRRKNIQPVEDHFFTFEEMARLLTKHGFIIKTYRGADAFRYYTPYHKYEMWLAIIFPWMHKRMKKIIFNAVKT